MYNNKIKASILQENLNFSVIFAGIDARIVAAKQLLFY